MDLVNWAILGTIVGSATATAGFALGGLSAYELRRSRRPLSVFGRTTRIPIFLFEDEDLVDATPPARQVLAVAPRDGSPWSRLLQALAPRFPALQDELTRLIDLGSVEVTSTDGRNRVIAEWRHGMVRVELVDLDRPRPADAIDRHALAALNQELETLRMVTDRVPYLTWREGPDGTVTWANQAYLSAAELPAATHPLPPWPPTTLFPPPEPPGTAQRLSLTLPGDRAPSWFEVQTLEDGPSPLRVALPADALVRAEEERQSFVQTLTKTFATLTVGLAIFDRSRRLALFNPALTDLTGLDPTFLAQRPGLYSFIDQLREMRSLPEPKNFETWRQRLSALEAAAAEGSLAETWSLPDGRIFQVTGRPHPDGALAFTFEDVSAEISLTRRFRTEVQLGQAALDTLDEALAVFAEDGQLLLANAAYQRLWRVDPRAAVAPSLSQSLRLWRTEAPTAPDWSGLSDLLLGSGLRRPTGFTVERMNGRRLDCRFVPLAGGAVLAGFTEEPALAPAVFRPHDRSQTADPVERRA